MAPEQIPDAVFRFIDECIDSVPQLEALLMMHAESARRWGAAEIAARTYVSLDEASRTLESLHRRGLIDTADARLFAISTADAGQRAKIELMAQTYRANLTRLATFIHSKPPAPLKEFARAFSLKKDH